jgi:hypothetical protein
MRRNFACSLAVLLMILPYARGQERIEFDFGLRTGVPFTVPFESSLTGAAAVFSSQAFSRPSVAVGPTFAVVVHDRIAIQFDALYKRSTFSNSFFTGTSSVSSSQRLSSWEFPLIADYAMLKGPLRPFGGGGFLLSDTYSERFLSQLPAYIINGGLDWRVSRLVIRPELRYTRWGSIPQATDVGRRENQLEYLVGFSLRTLRQ